MERATEATGADIEAAIAAGLADLGVERDAVEIDVLDEGSKGVFGLGAREARVHLTLKARTAPAPAPPAGRAAPSIAEPIEAEEEKGKSEAKIARGVLLELLALLDMDGAQVEVRRAEPAAGEGEPPWVLEIRGSDTDALIGYRGRTLAALQHITRLIVGRELGERTRLVVDVEGFKVRRERSLRRLAQRIAEQAVRTNRTVVLEPMPPNERRIIHMTLRDHPQVTTESIDEGERRKVTIIPRR